MTLKSKEIGAHAVNVMVPLGDASALPQVLAFGQWHAAHRYGRGLNHTVEAVVNAALELVLVAPELLAAAAREYEAHYLQGCASQGIDADQARADIEARVRLVTGAVAQSTPGPAEAEA